MRLPSGASNAGNLLLDRFALMSRLSVFVDGEALTMVSKPSVLRVDSLLKMKHKVAASAGGERSNNLTLAMH